MMRRDSLKGGKREQRMKKVISAPWQVAFSRVHCLPLPVPLMSGVRFNYKCVPNKKTPQTGIYKRGRLRSDFFLTSLEDFF